MTYREKLDQLARTMGEQQYQPVFEGNADAAVEYMDQFSNTITVYYQSILAGGLFARMKAMGAGEEIREQEEELMRTQETAREATARAIDDMNRVCQAYGEEPLTDIDSKDPEAVHDFVGEFCSELSREEE